MTAPPLTAERKARRAAHAALEHKAVDLVLPASHLGWSLADEIERLAPFGPGHAEPLLAVTGLSVVDARRVGASQAHLALRMRRGAEVFEAIAFDTPLDRPLPAPGESLDLLATLERDSFQGVARLRLRTIDYAAAVDSPLAARRAAAQRAAAGAIAVPIAVGSSPTLAPTTAARATG